MSVTIGGVTHHGTYYVQETMVHVQSPFGTKSAWIGLSHPHALARLLLSELVRAGERI